MDFGDLNRINFLSSKVQHVEFFLHLLSLDTVLNQRWYALLRIKKDVLFLWTLSTFIRVIMCTYMQLFRTSIHSTSISYLQSLYYLSRYKHIFHAHHLFDRLDSASRDNTNLAF